MRCILKGISKISLKGLYSNRVCALTQEKCNPRVCDENRFMRLINILCGPDGGALTDSVVYTGQDQQEKCFETL